jgi:hypothetical protein
MRCCGIKLCPAVGSARLIDLFQRDPTDQDAIAFHERQVGSGHQFSAAKHLANTLTSFFSK